MYFTIVPCLDVWLRQPSWTVFSPGQQWPVRACHNLSIVTPPPTTPGPGNTAGHGYSYASLQTTHEPDKWEKQAKSKAYEYLKEQEI